VTGRTSARRIVTFLLLLYLSVTALPPTAGAGSSPRLDWQGRGQVDWSSGFIIAYGSGVAPEDVTDLNLRRSASLRSAYRRASRGLLRLCLGLQLQDGLTVRDYIRSDPELQETLRRRLREIPPWEVRLEEGGQVRLALKIPLGGADGLIHLLGEVRGGEAAPRRDGLPPTFRGSGGRGGISGVVLLVSSREVVPALRPRVRGSGGAVLLDYESAAEGARSRPAFIPYYEHLEEAMADPLLGADPVVAAAGPFAGSSTDLLLPPLIETSLLATEEGRTLLEEARIVVVLQE
jgi:hypothetical protein